MAASVRIGLLRHLKLEKQIGFSLKGRISFLPADMHILQQRLLNPIVFGASFSSEGPGKDVSPEKKDTKTISKAMRLYLERSREHDAFMKKESMNFKIGKRHLANMMGEDPETFTQEDIDRAIEYLFPSGLFDPKARPLMKPPEEVFPQRKAAEFDESGRPHHFLFYTGKPNYYQLLHDIVTHMNEMNKYEDEMIRKNRYPGEGEILNLSGSEWITKESLETMLVETLSDREYDNFIKVMERLTSHPYAFRLKEYVFNYRKLLMSQTKTYEIPKPQIGEDGKSRITVTDSKRKTSLAQATITYPGTGKITINGADILYFRGIQSREQVSCLTLKKSYGVNMTPSNDYQIITVELDFST